METNSLREKLHQLIDSMNERSAAAFYEEMISGTGLSRNDETMAREDKGKYLDAVHVHELIFVVGETETGEFTARALGYSIHTEADSMDELRTAVKDAVHCHFDDDRKRIIRLHIVKEEVIAA